MLAVAVKSRYGCCRPKPIRRAGIFQGMLVGRQRDWQRLNATVGGRGSPWHMYVTAAGFFPPRTRRHAQRWRRRSSMRTDDGEIKIHDGKKGAPQTI